MRHVAIAFFLFLIILISGCIGQPSEGPAVEWREVIGTKGLDFEFYELRKEVQSGETFELALALENKGEADIEPGTFKVSLSGGSYTLNGESFIYNKSTLTKSVYSTDLGKIITTPDGVEPYWILGNTEHVGTKLPGGSFNIIVTGCYLYKTNASKKACIKAYSVEKKKDVCEPDSKVGWLSSGPIWIDRIEQRSIRNADTETMEHRFKIHVIDKGSGDAYPAYENGQINFCGDKNGATVTSVKMGAEDITSDCEFDSDTIVYTSGGTGEFMCYYDKTPGASYTQDFFVELAYTYEDQISKTIGVEV